MRSHAPTSALRRRLERALWVAGAVALGWCAVILAESRVYETVEAARYVARTPERFAETTTAPDPRFADVPAPPDDDRSPAPREGPSLPATDEPAAGDPLDRLLRKAATLLPGPPSIGQLEIPRIGMTTIVADGDDARTLARASGRLPGSARPGEAGNLVIAGHRDRHFRPLESVRPGDEIVLRTRTGRYRYRVSWTRVVPPDAVDVIAPTEHAALTLVTCYPFTWVGPAPDRFVVRASLVADPG